MNMSHLRAVGIACAVSTGVASLALVSSVAAGPSKTDLTLLGSVMQLVQQDYVHLVDSSQLTDDALKGLLSRLDPHSSYMTEAEFRESMADINGKFGGVGLRISDHNRLPTVISPIDGTPAARADVQPGDVIVAVDGESTHGEELTQVVRKIRGQPQTPVTLTIVRGNEPAHKISLVRQVIRVHSVKSKLEPDHIGYVRIAEFGHDTPNELRQAISTLKRDSGGTLTGLVLDLRDDPGGLLTSAVDVSADFLDGGAIVSIRGRNSGDDQSFTAPSSGVLLPKAPVVVLINGASASASEIVAGALQDRHRATVMGTQSFGKGSVQSIITIKGHGAVRLTTALYYTPSGHSIQGEGITPDIVVSAPKDQQVADALVWREDQLYGAFANPGPLTTSKSGENGNQRSAEPASPPIKEQLIGTTRDTQLAAALKFLDRSPAPTSADSATNDRDDHAVMRARPSRI